MTVFPLVLILSRPNRVAAAGMVITVPDDYSTVSLAVEAATDGDTIFVRAGQYADGNILVNKTLTIVGESAQNTTIDGGGTASFIFQIITSNVTLENFTLRHTINSFFQQGTSIRVFNVTNVNIKNVRSEEVYHGIELLATTFSTMIDCEVLNSTANGFYIHNVSTSNTIVGNTIQDNSIGIFLASTNDQFNMIYHNNFVNNTSQIVSFGVNYFDNGYPSGGNYFSDYMGTDMNRTTGQNVSGSDGIFDDPYLGDSYPFVSPLQRFHVAAAGNDFLVQASTNVTLTSCILNVSTKTLEFRVQTSGNFTGSVRVQIPKDLLSCGTLNEWVVTVYGADGLQTPSYLPLEDSNNTFLYFVYNQTQIVSKIEVRGTYVVSEYTFIWMVLLLAFAAGVIVLETSGIRKR